MLVPKDAGVANKGCCNVTGEGARGQRWITYIACVTEKWMAVGGGVRDVTKSVLATARGSSGGVWRGLRAAEGPQPSAGLRGEHWGSIPWSVWTHLALGRKGLLWETPGDPLGASASTPETQQSLDLALSSVLWGWERFHSGEGDPKSIPVWASWERGWDVSLCWIPAPAPALPTCR